MSEPAEDRKRKAEEAGTEAALKRERSMGLPSSAIAEVNAEELLGTGEINEKYMSRDHAAKLEEERGELAFHYVKNDGTPKHMMWLINLKNIFSKQLPKMPREYICRLVLDRNHRSMTVVKKDRVIGGICYRPYDEQRFAEIAFCAISTEEQVKGYGTRLMNHLKDQAKKDDLDHFLTYADNFAIGYFSKQGFHKNVMMPRERWGPFIKEYDGGTLMECEINFNLSYTDIPGMIKKHRRGVFMKLKQFSHSHIVYEGLGGFARGQMFVEADSIPGLKHSREAASDKRQAVMSATAASVIAPKLLELFELLLKQPGAECFNSIGDMYSSSAIEEKSKIGLDTIRSRLEAGHFYRCKEMLMADLLRLISKLKDYHASANPAALPSVTQLELWVQTDLSKRSI